jgi:hypothetical protein
LIDAGRIRKHPTHLADEVHGRPSRCSLLTYHRVERRHHSIAFEPAAFQVGVVPTGYLKKVARWCRCSEAVLVLVPVCGVDDVHGLASATHSFDQEWVDHVALLAGTVDERASVIVIAKLCVGQRGCERHSGIISRQNRSRNGSV